MSNLVSHLIGQKVIIRSYASGVHFGLLQEASDDLRSVLLTNSRRVHYWSGAASLSQMATEGVNNPDACRFSVVTPQILINQVEEIIPISETAIVNLESVPVWKV